MLKTLVILSISQLTFEPTFKVIEVNLLLAYICSQSLDEELEFEVLKLSPTSLIQISISCQQKWGIKFIHSYKVAHNHYFNRDYSHTYMTYTNFNIQSTEMKNKIYL